MRTADGRSKPFNFAPQALTGGEATLVFTSERRLRIKGEDDTEPGALVEPEDDELRPPSLADEPLDPVVLANRAKLEALRRGRAPVGPLDLADFPAHARRPLRRGRVPRHRGRLDSAWGGTGRHGAGAPWPALSVHVDLAGLAL